MWAETKFNIEIINQNLNKLNTDIKLKQSRTSYLGGRNYSFNNNQNELAFRLLNADNIKGLVGLSKIYTPKIDLLNKNLKVAERQQEKLVRFLKDNNLWTKFLEWNFTLLE